MTLKTPAYDASPLYLAVTEFMALQAFGKDAIHCRKLNVPLTPTETINITNKITKNLPVTFTLCLHTCY